MMKNSCSTTTEKPSTTLSKFEQRMLGLREKLNELVKAHEQLKTDREKFEEKKREMQDTVDKTDVIRLNVGGELMMTTRATLTRVSKSILGTMFNGRWEHQLNNDQDGNIVLDFNPVLFRHLLDQLRVLENENAIVFRPPPSLSLVAPFEKMLRKLGLHLPSTKSLEAVITLDVGGERVTTRHTTLIRVRKLKFLSTNVTSINITSNRFLDYAPKMFRHLLKQLREEPEANTSGYNAPSHEEKDAFYAMLIDLDLKNSTTITNTGE